MKLFQDRLSFPNPINNSVLVVVVGDHGDGFWMHFVCLLWWSGCIYHHS
jgi:hypothetical protein